MKLKFVLSKKKLLILLLYFCLAIFFSYPLIKNMSSTIPGWPMDGYNYIWNVDTFWNQLLNLRNPFYTNRIFYPVGTGLIIHTYAPVISLLGIFFLKDLPFYMNFLILLSFVIAAYSFYKLSKMFIQNEYISVLSGFVYAFSPIMVSYITSQHYYFLFGSSLLPFIPLNLLKENDGRRILKSIVVLWIIFFIDYYIFIVGSILFLITIATLLKMKEIKMNDLYKPFLVVGIVPVIIYYLLILRGNNLGLTAYRENGYPSICNINIANLTHPSPHNSILSTYKNDFSIDLDTPSYYFGYLVLFFSLIGVLAGYKKWQYRIFIFFGITILLLSIGPNLRYNDTVKRLSFSPYSFFAKIPFMNMVDCPKRFIVGFQMGLSLIFSTGLAYFIDRIKIKKFKLILFFITFFIFIEYFSFNIPMSDIYIPDVYRIIRDDKTNKTILELPSGVTESKRGWGYDWSISGLHLMQHYWQTYHHKPRVGGSLSRVANPIYDQLGSDPMIKYLFDLTTINSTYREVSFSKDEVSNSLKRNNLGYIVFSPNQRQEIYINAVKNIFRDKIILEILDDRGYYLIKLVDI